MEPDAIESWDVDDVVENLKSIGVGDACIKAIRKEKIDGPTLVELIEEDGLEEIGVKKKLDRAKIKGKLSPSKRPSVSPARVRAGSVSPSTAIVQSDISLEDKQRVLDTASSKRWSDVIVDAKSPTAKIIDLVYDYNGYYTPHYLIFVYPFYLSICLLLFGFGRMDQGMLVSGGFGFVVFVPARRFES